MQPEITARSWLMVATLGIVWGASFPFVEVALTGTGPYWLAAWRIVLAAVLTHAIWAMRGQNLYETSEKSALLSLLSVGAMSTAVPFMAISWGQQYVTAGFAGVSMAAVALLVLPLAHFLVPGEQLNKRKSLGFAIGFVGVLVLIGPEAFTSSGSNLEIAGRFACLFAASCYAISSVIIRRIPPVDPIGLSAVTLWIGAGVAVCGALVLEGLPPLPPTNVIGVIVILGLFQTAAANLLRISVVRTSGPTFMSLTNYQVPFWSVVLGVTFLGEPLEMTLFLAMALILAGVALSQWGALKRLFGQPAA